MKTKIFFTILTMGVLLAANAQLNELELNENALALLAENNEFPKTAKSWKHCLKFAKKTTKKVPHLYTNQVNKQANGIMDYRALTGSHCVWNRPLIRELIQGYIDRMEMINWNELMYSYNYQMQRKPFTGCDLDFDPNAAN